MTDKTILTILAVLSGIILISAFFGANRNRNMRRLRRGNGGNANLKMLPEDLIPSSQLSSSQPACTGCDNYDDTNFKALHHNERDLEPICSQDAVWPTCEGPGTTIYGMTVADQSIYPGSYLPAALWNTSGYSPSCAEKQAQPNPCFN